MLSMLSGDRNIDVIKWLIEESECDTDVKDWQENNILHLAVKYCNTKIVNYLVCTKIVDPFQRNSLGESAISMAQELELHDISSILSNCKDNSSQKMDELLEFINEEEKNMKAMLIVI